MSKIDATVLKDMMDEQIYDSTYSIKKDETSRRDRLEINNTEKTDKNAKDSPKYATETNRTETSVGSHRELRYEVSSARQFWVTR